MAERVGVLWQFEIHPPVSSVTSFESTDNTNVDGASYMNTFSRYYLHSAGAYFASNVGVTPSVIPVGALAPFAMQRHATTDWSVMLNSAVASGNALAEVACPG